MTLGQAIKSTGEPESSGQFFYETMAASYESSGIEGFKPWSQLTPFERECFRSAQFAIMAGLRSIAGIKG